MWVTLFAKYRTCRVPYLEKLSYGMGSLNSSVPTCRVTEVSIGGLQNLLTTSRPHSERGSETF